MSLKTIHINSTFLFFLFLLFIFLISSEIYTKFLYLTYILLFLFLTVAFINLCLLFFFFKKENEPTTLFPALIFHFVLIGLFEFIIFYSEKSYSLDRFFLFYGLIFCLFFFLFYMLLKQIKHIKFNKAVYLSGLKFLIPFNVKAKIFNFKWAEKFKQHQFKIIKNIENNQFNKSIKKTYQVLLSLVIVGIVIISAFSIFKKFSALWILTSLIIGGFICGFIIAFVNKELHFSQLSYYSLIKSFFITNIMFGICLGVIYFSLSKVGFDELMKEYFTVKWYEVPLISWSMFSLEIGANIKYLLFDRKAQ